MELRSAALELPVSDVALAADFYEQRFGFQRGEVGDGSAVLRRDRVEIRLWSAGELEAELAAAGHRDLDGGSPRVAGSASGRIEVSGLHALYERCRRDGTVHPHGELGRVEAWGIEEFAALDLDHNCLSFYEPVES